MLNGTTVLKLVVMAGPIMIFASWQALCFGDSLVYVNSLEAWRLGGFIDGNLSFLPAVKYFIQSLTTSPPQLTYWTVMLGSITLVMVSMTLALSPVLPRRVLTLYAGLLLFLIFFTSFDATNGARHVFFMAPWAITIGITISTIARGWRSRYIAVIPFALVCTLINVVAVARYYHGEWVS